MKDVADITLKQDQALQNSNEKNKHNLIMQVSPEELDGEEFLRDDFNMDDELHRDSVGQNYHDVRSPRPQVETSQSTEINEAKIGETFRKNKLSIDPVVLPTSKLEKIIKVPMKTLEREQST